MKDRAWAPLRFAELEREDEKIENQTMHQSGGLAALVGVIFLVATR